MYSIVLINQGMYIVAMLFHVENLNLFQHFPKYFCVLATYIWCGYEIALSAYYYFNYRKFGFILKTVQISHM